MSIQNLPALLARWLLRGRGQYALRENFHDSLQALLGRELVRFHETIIGPQAAAGSLSRPYIMHFVPHAWIASAGCSVVINCAN